MNVVTLIGNLATDVDLRELGDERRVATFVLAVGRPGRDEVDLVRIAAWDEQAEACTRVLAKGRRVGVDGRLRSSSWQDEQGRHRTSLEVVANNVQLLSPPDGSASAEPTAAEEAESPVEEAAVP